MNPVNNPEVKLIYCKNSPLGFANFSSTGTSERSREFQISYPDGRPDLVHFYRLGHRLLFEIIGQGVKPIVLED